jgi:hypothetical protein
VRLEVGELGEGLAASRVLALVGLFARVRADVLLQVAQLREAALADLALVRLDARVDAGVLREVRRIRKALIARRAFIRFRVLLMYMLAMDEQVRFRLKYLQGKAERRHQAMVLHYPALYINTQRFTSSFYENKKIYKK